MKAFMSKRADLSRCHFEDDPAVDEALMILRHTEPRLEIYLYYCTPANAPSIVRKALIESLTDFVEG